MHRIVTSYSQQGFSMRLHGNTIIFERIPKSKEKFQHCRLAIVDDERKEYI